MQGTELPQRTHRALSEESRGTSFFHWTMEHNRGWDSLTFEAIKQKIRCREALPLQHQVYSYVSRGFYSEQLRRLWQFFPKTNKRITTR